MKVQIVGIDVHLFIEEKRNERLMSQRKLAEISGVSRSYICELSKGRYIPSVLTLGKIAKALGCTMDELISIN